MASATQPGKAALATVREQLRRDAASGRFAGVVLIAKAGSPIYTEAFGLAENASGAKNSVATRFCIGSIGKLFTEVAVMQLAQAGKLDLNGPIRAYLPDYPNTETAGNVTINELMTHSGGTGDEFGPLFDAHQSELRTPSDFIALFGDRAPEFPPGSKQSYSNFGFMILGRIIERVSGLSYDDYVRRNIFVPAGLNATDDAPLDQADPHRATPYMTVAGKLQRASVEAVVNLRNTPDAHGYLTYKGEPNGGGYSTAGDLLRFIVALKSNRLLDKAHTELLLTGLAVLPTGKSFHYDMGGPLPGGQRFLGHDGAMPGSSAIVRNFPDGYTVIVLANRDQPLAPQLLNDIASVLLGPADLPATPPQ